MPRHLRVLAIFLGPDLIGHLGHFEGRNVFAATPDYVANPLRRTLSLAFHDPSEEVTRRLLTHRSDRISSNLRLPPFFSNLLPEGALRARIAAELKVSEEQEFDLLAALGGDLPGAVTASVAERAPSTITDYFRLSSTVDVSTRVGRAVERFSLSGVQLKFSVLLDVRRRYTLARETESGSIIIKLPHPGRLLLPENEYSCMTLARLAGVDTPD